MQTTFAFVIEGAGDTLEGSELHIPAADEADARRLADARSRMMRLPLRRAVDRDVRVIVKAAS